MVKRGRSKRGKVKKRKEKEIDIKKSFLETFLRYVIILLSSINGFWLFYFIFTPLTIYPVYWILNIFFNASLLGEIVLLNNIVPIELVPACIAGSAYFLLLALNLSTRDIKIKKRLSMIGVSFLSLWVVNIIRIFSFAMIFMAGYFFFDAAHKLFWYGLSTIFVVVIWFVVVKKFNIKTIPFYSDVKYLYNYSNLSNR